jgi:MoaA/NifB/PqqE/SkfB family radical SAM enzyme
MNVSEIESLELELTSRCNAACPQCPRTNEKLFTSDLNHNREITVENLKTWLPKELLNNLNRIVFKGTFSEPLISKYFVEIIEYLKENTRARIKIHTNGSLRNKTFWKWLALNLPKNSSVVFALDGLADTHSIYRINTNFDKILENAKVFIENKGNAHWQFIIFKHNEHQIDEARKLSKQLGFSNFFTMYSDRTIENEFTKNHNSFVSITHEVEKKLIKENIIKKQVVCKSLQDKEIFINWDGELFPCCMTGIYSTKSKNYFDFIVWKKNVLKNNFTNNNLNYHTLEEILKFYDNFYKDIEISPKIITCSKNCGIN